MNYHWVTQPLPHVEQELPTLPEHLSSLPVFIGVCVAQSLVSFLCSVLLNIVLCILCPLIMTYDYLFDIFKLFVFSVL